MTVTLIGAVLATPAPAAERIADALAAIAGVESECIPDLNSVVYARPVEWFAIQVQNADWTPPPRPE